MSEEIEIFSKDYIKIYCLNDVTTQKTTSLKLFLESDGVERDFLEVRSPERSVYRFNNFNVTEESNNDCVTFRPNVIGCYSKFTISSGSIVKIEIIRNGTSNVAKAFELGNGISTLEFEPQGIKKYDLKVFSDGTDMSSSENTSGRLKLDVDSPATNPFESDYGSASPFDMPSSPKDDLANNAASTSFSYGSMSLGDNNSNTIQTPSQINVPRTMPTRVSESDRERDRVVNQLESSNARLQADLDELDNRKKELERKNQELIDKKRELTSHLDRLQEEYDKNYSSFNEEVEEISSRYHIDSEILKLYSNSEVTPIEELLGRAEDDINKIEEQIRVFVEAQERKTVDIEKELKIGKKD